MPRFAKRKRETEGDVIRIKATPAAFVGTVQARDKATALKTEQRGPSTLDLRTSRLAKPDEVEQAVNGK